MGFRILPFATGCSVFAIVNFAALALVSVPFAHAGVQSVPSVSSVENVQHTVGRGHTLEAIAHRYHVTAKAIIEANHLDASDVKHLRVGEVLTIPGVKAPPSKGENAVMHTQAKAKGVDVADKKTDKLSKVGKTSGRETTTFAMKAKTPGVIHAHRVSTTESFEVRVGDSAGHVSPTALKTFEKMMRSPAGLSHPINARLVTLLGVVSNHFGSRPVEVISGFRPFTPKQFNPHSNHMHGKAIDFRVAGVPNEAVRDFCRTLRNVGCGYYPSSVFVHMDVRDQSAFWIDFSKPGERPRYNAPNTDADEGTSDVQEVANEAPSTATSLPSLIEGLLDAPGNTTSPTLPTSPILPIETPSAPAVPAGDSQVEH